MVVLKYIYRFTHTPDAYLKAGLLQGSVFIISGGPKRRYLDVLAGGDIPVRKIDNATMVRIMAEENLNWSTRPAVTTQTVLAAKEFLDAELAKCETWEVIRYLKMILPHKAPDCPCERR